jgi:hypothetical protein
MKKSLLTAFILGIVLVAFNRSTNSFTSNTPVTLASGSASNAATMPINFSQWVGSGAGKYTNFELFIDVTPLSGGPTLEFETSANGTSFDNAAFDYYWNCLYTSGTGAAANTSVFGSTDNVIQTGAGFGDSTAMHSIGVIWIINPASTSNHAQIRGDLIEYVQQPSTGGHGLGTLGLSAARRSAAAIKGLTVLFSSGNITGTWYLVGYP